MRTTRNQNRNAKDTATSDDTGEGVAAPGTDDAPAAPVAPAEAETSEQPVRDVHKGKGGRYVMHNGRRVRRDD